MRPLILISSLTTGGAERVTVSFLERLVRRGGNATLCTLQDRHDSSLADEIRAAGIERYDLGARRLADPRALFRYVRLLRRHPFDIVHAHGQDASILAMVAHRFVRVPLVITRHVQSEPTENWRQRVRAAAALFAFARADAAVAVSEATADSLASQARLSRERIHVIPNGIDLAPFDAHTLAAARQRLRRQWGYGPDTSVVLMAAVLRPGKGHEVLLAALPTIKKRIPNVRILIAGTGPLEADLRSRAALHGDTVQFLGHRDDIPQLMAASDLIVLPTFSEALPTVLMEAAAAARPVVATRVGGVEEVVVENRTGLLVPPADPMALAEAIDRLLSDSALSHAFSEAARGVALERFNLDLQMQRTVTLWEEIVTGTMS